jgi:hypothetical protein
MSIEEQLNKLFVNRSSSTKEIWEAIDLIVIAESLSPAARGTLEACHNRGPLFDGDIPSKIGRDELFRNMLLSKVVVQGEQGYNACTQKGFWVLKVLDLV